MKRLSMAALLFFLSIFGAAHAENVYDMSAGAFQIKLEEGPDSHFDPVPISKISNDQLTFSGDVVFRVDKLTTACCQLNLGNQGSFTVAFDKPVNSVGLNIFPVPLSSIDLFAGLGSSTVSAVYKNSEGEIVGESSVTANWISELFSFEGQWNNTFNGHESAFGVSSIEGFSEITFSVDGMSAIYEGKGATHYGPLNLGSTELYYSYINPVPEPETYALLLAGLSLIGLMAKRRKNTGIMAA